MNFSILSWNIHGLGSLDERNLVKDMVKTSDVEIVFLQESKLQSMQRGALC